MTLCSVVRWFQINLSETLSTLRYANRARNIQNKAVKNTDPVHEVTSYDTPFGRPVTFDGLLGAVLRSFAD